jgi:hypothetical protein
MSRSSIVRGWVAAALATGVAAATADGQQRGSRPAAAQAQAATAEQKAQLQKVEAREQAASAEWHRVATKRFEDDRRAFLEKRAAALKAENAKVRAQIERLRKEGA